MESGISIGRIRDRYTLVASGRLIGSIGCSYWQYQGCIECVVTEIVGLGM